VAHARLFGEAHLSMTYRYEMLDGQELGLDHARAAAAGPAR
jgi:hypothetical protein